MAGTAPSPTTQTSHVSSTARSFPPGLVPAAVVLAAAVGLLSLLPSLAQAVWEVPHLVVLGLVISYGVFAQRNTDDVDRSFDGDGNGTKDGALAPWNARYRPGEPLIVVGDHAANGNACEGAMERPLSLPVRRLKPPPPATQESDTGEASDGVGEETGSSASSAGFCAGAHTAPSPPSVLDAELGLSPCPRSPPPFFAHSSVTTSRSFSSGHRYPCTPRKQPLSEDGEVTDWDEDVDGSSDDMTVSSERSVRGYFVTDGANDHNDGYGHDDDEDDESSVDEELLKLASKAAPEGEDEVDRKADEFIAHFRQQIKLQRL